MKQNVKQRKIMLFLLIPLFLSTTTSVFCTAHPQASEQKESGTPPVKGIQGIDVSHYSGSVDWAKVKAAGYTFAFAKATEGVGDKDPMFSVHWPALKKATLIRGAYHYYVTEDDPKEQAKFFISNVALKKGDLAPVVDIETVGTSSKSDLLYLRLRTFLNILEKHYGITPIIYTDFGFWNTDMNDKFGSYPLWLAEYDVESPQLPEGWSTYSLWQWAGDAVVPGVEKTADISVSNSKKDFSTLLIK